jgi:hypothetical protein
MWRGQRDARGVELIVLDEWQLQELRARTESEVFERVISIASNMSVEPPINQASLTQHVSA